MLGHLVLRLARLHAAGRLAARRHLWRPPSLGALLMPTRARWWGSGAAALAALAGMGGPAVHAQAPMPAPIQDGQKIAVIINDEVVSARDVQRRIDLILRSAN